MKVLVITKDGDRSEWFEDVECVDVIPEEACKIEGDSRDRIQVFRIQEDEERALCRKEADNA